MSFITGKLIVWSGKDETIVLDIAVSRFRTAILTLLELAPRHYERPGQIIMDVAMNLGGMEMSILRTDAYLSEDDDWRDSPTKCDISGREFPTEFAIFVGYMPGEVGIEFNDHYYDYKVDGKNKFH